MMNQEMSDVKNGVKERKESCARKFLERNEWDIYGSQAMLNFYYKDDVERANNVALKVALWFELPHPTGRDHRGEVDFAAIRLVRILYQSFGLLTDEVKNAIKKFFLTYNFASMHGSENHSLIFFVSRYLAAQFYTGEYFIQYKKNASELLESDCRYLREFIRFRARFGWGEFDSCGYSAEVLMALETLYDFCNDQKLKNLTHMMIDLILMDMAVDCLDGGLLGGAHGRIYEKAAMDNLNSKLFSYYVLYFGSRYGSERVCPTSPEDCVSTYIPSDIVYEMVMGRKFPYENREAKNLHLMSAWMEGHDIIWKKLFLTNGRISKYTYLTDKYAIGAVNFQDKYRINDADAWYAHHQQHEWDLTIAGDTGIKIFGHHPGHESYYNQHGYWTGDLGCCCGTFFCDKNILVSMYDIVKEDELDFIHVRVPFVYMDEIIEGEKLLLLRCKDIYIALHFLNGYRIVTEGDYANNEVISEGRKNALCCEVGTCKFYTSFQKFCSAMQNKVPKFDRENMILSYGNIKISKDRRYIDDRLIDVHYDTYDSPYLKSKWDSGIIYILTQKRTVVYDFNNETVWQA